jgi:hypothetical protein
MWHLNDNEGSIKIAKNFIAGTLEVAEILSIGDINSGRLYPSLLLLINTFRGKFRTLLLFENIINFVFAG